MGLRTLLRRHIALAAIPLGLSADLILAVEPAFAQSPPPTLESLQARIDAAALALGNNPRFKGLSPTERQQLAQFVAGNVLFVLLHELGHTVTTEFGIPILGRKEDAADSFAVTRLIKLESSFSDGVLVEAGRGWFLAAKRDKETGDTVPYYDEHGLNEQRAYQIVCMMVGSGQEKYQYLAEKTGLPKSRQASCAEDYSEASNSWDMVLKPHLRAPDQVETKVDVAYGEAEGKLAPGAQALRSVMLLETVAERVAYIYSWPAPFAIEIQSCGFPNAQWRPDIRKLMLCYELGADFADLYRRYGNAGMKTSKRKSK